MRVTHVTPVSAAFLGIFFISLVGFYIAIRRKSVRPSLGGIMATIINTTTLVAFGIINPDIGNDWAILGGLLVGLIFSGAMVGLAVFFLQNEAESFKWGGRR